MRNRLALLALLGAFAAHAASQVGTLTSPAELRSTPFADGKALKTLPKGARVEVIKRVGGWYQVKATGTDGWVRMWLVRFSTPATGGSALKQDVAVLQSGRGSSTYATATTGVRGLSEEDLKNATPNPKAVAALEQLGVTPEDARGFARKGALKADPNLLRDPR